MTQIKSLTVAISSALLLAGCGSSSSDDSAAMANVTAIDGYLSNAKVFLQNTAGECLTNAEPLALTNEQGIATVILSDLSAGFCVVADHDTIDMDAPTTPIALDFTLYAPEPSVLDQGNNAVISPFTSYLQLAITEAKAQEPNITEEGLATVIDDAKTALLDAYTLDSTDAAVSALLVTDFIAAKTTGKVMTEAQKLHRLAQITVDITALNQAVPTPTQTVNLAAVLTTELNSDDADLDKLASFLAPRIDELSDNSNVEELKHIVSDPTLLDQIPVITADSLALSQQFADAIANGNFGDTGLVVNNIALTDITVSNADVSNDAVMILTAAKIDAEWAATTVASTDQETTSFANQELSIDEITLLQSGEFVYRLAITTDIDGTNYRSNTIVFSVGVNEEILPNQAPVYVGNEHESSQALISSMDAAVNDDFALFDPADYGLEGDAELSLDPGMIDLSPLFTDAQQQELSFWIDGNASDFADIDTRDQPDLFCMSAEMCFFSTTVPVPSEGESNYRMMLWAADSMGALSDSPMHFTLTVDADKVRSVTFGDGSGGDDDGGDYGAPFNGMLLSDSQLDTAATDVEKALNGEGSQYKLDQMFVVKEYQCNSTNKCAETTTVVPEADYSLEQNPYLTISDGFLVATGTAVAETTELALTPTLAGENVKLYLVDGNKTIVDGDINGFGQQLALALTTSGEVTIRIADNPQ